MSSESAIRVDGLSKCFQIYDTPRDRLKQFVLPHLPSILGLGARRYYREFWALRGVSLDVKKGETVGIVGRNGSGKSTLLQLICGTLSPTSGTIETNGRIAALLELGSGFNPEFTGRENVYLNGAVLGLGREEVDARFDDIAAFADIGQFIEQPVKTYSSGMMVRLAFAVAINVDPQILVVDEALSVGDELFQRKCFSRIETIRSAGATILFVSHSGGTVVELCDRAVLMDAGEQLAVDAPKKIVGRYQKLLYAPADKRDAVREEIRREDSGGFGSSSQSALPQFTPIDLVVSVPPAVEVGESSDSYDPMLKPASTIVYESHGAVVEEPTLYNLAGERVNNLTGGRRYRYCYRVRFSHAANNVRFGMLIKTTSGLELGGGASASSVRTSLPYVTSGSVFVVEFEFSCWLNAGVYFLNAGVMGDLDGSETYLHRVVDVAMFRVTSGVENLSTGLVDFSCKPHVAQESG